MRNLGDPVAAALLLNSDSGTSCAEQSSGASQSSEGSAISPGAQSGWRDSRASHGPPHAHVGVAHVPVIPHPPLAAARRLVQRLQRHVVVVRRGAEQEKEHR